MPAQLIPLTIHNPGSSGLNSQDSTAPLPPTWATVLENAVFDDSGRIRCRNGWTALTTSSTFGAYDLEQLHCWEGPSTTVVIVAGNNDILYGTSTLVSLKGSLTITANNWQFQNWIDSSGNTKVVAWQTGHAPIVSTVTAGVPGNFAAISASSGTVPQGNCCLAAFGRIWCTGTDGTTLYYSGLLDETQWASGGAGSANTLHYWPRGTDYITAIAAWENYLVVFGKRNILIYANPDDIGNFPLLKDTIEGVGCIARDSVQVIGSDIVFLSETGMRSLRRTLETEKNNLQEMATQVRDLLIPYINGNEAKIRSVYNQQQGFYLLVIPDSGDPTTFLFDFKAVRTRNLLGGATIDLDNVRVSTWKGWNAKAVGYGRNNVMYGTFRDQTDSDEGVVGSYTGFSDNGEEYLWRYWSPWIDLDEDTQKGGGLGAFLKIPKTVLVTIVGGAGNTFDVRWSYNYKQTFDSESFVLPESIRPISEWGEGEWGLSEYGYVAEFDVTTERVHASEYGNAIRLGMAVTVSGQGFSLQRMDLIMKRGRLIR